MKRYMLFVLVGIFALSCLRCTKPPVGKLQIVNLRSEAIDDIEWNGQPFGDQFILERFSWGLYPGNANTREVEPGSAPVIFRSVPTHDLYETVEIVEVEEGEHVSFTITDSTPIRCLTPPKTKLQISNMRSEAIDDIEWNGYQFGDQFILQRGSWGLYPGNADTREVNPGSSPVIFRSVPTHDLYETIEIVEVEEGEHVSFTITDSIPVRNKL
jgi:uncharacterized protein YndB with AHSA1/START domain